jgi:hypothetical protein
MNIIMERFLRKISDAEHKLIRNADDYIVPAYQRLCFHNNSR